MAEKVFLKNHQVTDLKKSQKYFFKLMVCYLTMAA